MAIALIYILVVFSQNTLTTAASHDYTLFDVTHILQNFWGDENLDYTPIRGEALNILENIIVSSSPLLFYETDFNQQAFKQISELSNALDTIWKKKKEVALQDSPAILVSFRFNPQNIHNTTMSSHKYVIGFSFEYFKSSERNACLTTAPNVQLSTASEIDQWSWGSSPPYFSRSFSNLFNTNITNYLAVGVTLDPTLMQCRALFNSISSADLLVVNLAFVINKNFVGSYSVYKKLLKTEVMKIKQTLSSVVPSSQGYLLWPKITHISAESQNEKINKHPIINEYTALVNDYSDLWLSENDDNKFGIVKQALVEHNQKMMKEPPQSIPYLAKIRDADWMSSSDICSLTSILTELTETGFDTVVISPRVLKGLLTVLGEKSPPPTCYFGVAPTITNISIFLELDPPTFEALSMNQNLSLFENDLSTLLKANVNLKSPILPFPNNMSLINSYARQNPLKESTSFACVAHSIVFDQEKASASDSVSHSSIINDTETMCVRLSFPVHTYIWKLEFDFYNLKLNNFDLPEFIREVMQKLEVYYITARHHISRTYPNSTVVLMISGGVSPTDEFHWKDRLNPRGHGLFCFDDAAEYSVLYEAVLTWARINGFPVIFRQNEKRRYDNPVIWQRLEASESFTNEIPIYIRRLYNTSQVVGDWTNGAYPCIPSIVTTPTQELNFDHPYSTALLPLNIKKNVPLTAEEVQVLLLLTLQKFSSVEMLLAEDDFLKKLKVLIDLAENPIFSKNLKINGVKRKRISLEILFMPSENQNLDLFNMLSQLEENFLRNDLQLEMQFSNWQIPGIFNNLHDYLMSARKVFSTSQISIGLTVPSCEHIGNVLLNDTKSEGDKLKEVPFHLVDYLVCKRQLSIDFIKGTVVKAWYLEGSLYIQKLLMMLFPNLKSVRFRLNHQLDESSSSLRTTEDTLKYLNDVNNFAKSHRIHYTLIPAFIPSNSSFDASWWNISNFTDLTDLLIYQNIESMLLNKLTWKPVVLKDYVNPKERNDDSNASNSNEWVSGLVFGIALVLLIASGAIGYKIKRNAKLLSKNEIYEFLNGRDEGEDEGIELNQYDGEDIQNPNGRFTGRKFNREFEIPKNWIFINKKRILGTGQFGIVYRGTFGEDEQDVAIKMPSCNSFNKNSFLDMLNEVKLLCYIGSHVNLVTFMGSYTKEISRGILYVVLELCEGGSLHGYLRKINGSKNYAPVSDLIKFCKEIACGMDYISKQNVIHGDLAARNVLLDSHLTCKIGDFGMSRKLYDYQLYVKNGEEPLPWRWMAFESLKRMEFSTQSDVWSFGVTAWEIFSLGDVPYPGLTWNVEFVEQLEEGMRMTMPRYSSQEIYEVMRKCWEIGPQDRLSFKEIFIFFAGLTTYDNVI